MKVWKVPFFLVIYFQFSYNRIYAQDSSVTTPGSKWTLQQCIKYAIEHNTEINTYRLNELLANQDLLLSKSSRLPNLTGSGTQYISRGKNFNSITGNLQNNTNLTGNYAINSSVSLYNGSYIKNDVRQKELQLQTANLIILQGENDITIQVTQAFLNILLARENAVYLKNILLTSGEQVVREKNLYDAGSIAKKDLVQMQAQYASDKYNLVTAENAARQNNLVLKQLLLLSVETTFDVSSPDSVTVQRIYPAFSEVLNTALQNRPEIESGQLSVAVAELDFAKAKSGLRPILTASGNLSSGYINRQGLYFTQLDGNFFQQAGLNLSVPIFNRRVTKTTEEKAKIGIAQAKLNLLNTKTVLSQQIEQAHINIENAESQYNAAVEELKAATESYRTANEQLKAGAVNTVELLLQKNLYIQALQAHTQAKYNTLLYIKIYTFYMGYPVTL